MADIAIRSIRKSYGKTPVLHGVDLTIAHGEFVVILGPSGCGKSTLLRMIAGLEAIDSGEIAIGGTVVNALEPRERGCAMVFQNYALYPHMSVAQNIGYALKVAGRPKAERERRILEVAKLVGLEDFLDRKPNALSGGQRQRVAMGRAMIREPKVFLFDEPLSNLDAKLRVQMRLEIRRLHQRLGATSVFVTHDQIEAMTLADRIVVMHAGQIEQVGTPRALYARPATRFVASFMGSPAMNMMEAEIIRPGLARIPGGIEIAYDVTRAIAVSGQKVTLGIRPDDVSILHAKSEMPGRTYPVTIDFTEEMGASRLIHSRLGESDFTLLQQTSEIDDATALMVSIPDHAIHLFDLETGLRLPAQQASDNVVRAA